MALSFPSNPSVDQIYSDANNSWRWNGSVWKKYNTIKFPSGNIVGLDSGSATVSDITVKVQEQSSDEGITYPGTGIAVSTGVGWTTSLAPPASSLVGISDSQTLSNKRISPRVSSTASATSITPDISQYDIYAFTALAAALTINAPIGTPADGDRLVFRILDNGTTRTLTWNSTYTTIGTSALPTATTINKTTYIGCIYNANNSRWDVVAINTQA